MRKLTYSSIIILLIAIASTSCKNPVAPDNPTTPADQVVTPDFSPPPGLYTSNQDVVISTSTLGAEIWCTTDGSEPSTTNGFLYTSSIDITENTTLNAIAFKTGMTDSVVSTGEYNFQHPPIILDPSPGNFTTAQTVSISGIQPGFNVKYTTDGSDPSPTNGADYSDPLTIDRTTILKVCLFKDGWTELDVTATYTFGTPKPSFSVAPGTYENDFELSLSCELSGASIYYTTDESDPSPVSGIEYTDAIKIDKSQIVKAIACYLGQDDSEVVTASYTMQVASPVFRTIPGIYTTDVSVGILSDTYGCTIRYTTDGTTPTEAIGQLYSGSPLSIPTLCKRSLETEVKVIAYKYGYSSSAVIAGTYTVQFPSQRQFYAQKATDYSWYTVDAILRGSSSHSAVYVANDQSVSDLTAQNIANEFENKIYPLVRTKFTIESDVDNNGRIILLLIDIIDGYTGSGGYVAGYFSPYHELTGASYPLSNVADMVFMDTNPMVPGSDDFHIAVVHEFQHLVDFNKTFILGGGKIFDTWITEGLSSAAEYLYQGSHIAWKIDYYNADPYDDIIFGTYFVRWAPSYGNPLSSYSTVYLFFQWLRIQFGDGVYTDILNDGSVTHTSVENAVDSRTGFTYIWPLILRDWFVANAFNNDAGLWGYNSEILLSPRGFNAGYLGSDWYLASGEGIYIIFSTPFSPASQSDIYHAGLDMTAKTVDIVPAYTGNVCLTLNISGNPAGLILTAPIPLSAYLSDETTLVAQLTQSGGRSVSDFALGSWPIDLLKHLLWESDTPRVFSLGLDDGEHLKQAEINRLRRKLQ